MTLFSRLRNRQLIALSLAALAIAVRLPFLASGKMPFDSDEAVEGLMARHLLNGEFSAFFWGQAFKGVPEVYAAAAAFAIFGSSVMTLKSATLAFFAAYVAVNFALLDKIAGRWGAVAASLLLIFAPPALVLWSLAASAEYIVIMLLGTILLLLCVRREEAGRAQGNGQRAETQWLGAIGLIVGLGLWVHQIFAVYLVPVALILTLQSRWWKRQDFGKPGKAAKALAAVATFYLALGVFAFITDGFSLQLGSIVVSATASQKMVRIAAGIAGLALTVHVLASMTRRRARALATSYWPLALGLLIGYLPVLLYSVLVEPARSPTRVANLRQLLSAAPDIVGNIVPILAGFKLATTERLALPLIAVLPGIAALMAYLWMNRRRFGRLIMLRAYDASVSCDFFPLFAIFVPVLFLLGGVYIDTQSYRYLIPWYAGLSVAWAAGSLALAGERKAVAAAIVGAILAVHAWQQVIWYQKLTPDTTSLAILDCLKRNGIRGGYADYWTAYRLTFIAQEEIIVAPTDGIDRYPRYTEYVRSLPAHQQVRLKADTTDCLELQSPPR